MEEKERVLGSVRTYVVEKVFLLLQISPTRTFQQPTEPIPRYRLFLLLFTGGGRRKCPLFSKAKEK